jgi:predicted nucleotidyltransferase component of viral defense system
VYSIITLQEEERRTIFRNTAQKIGIHEAIIEKDFWVCIVLDYLFHKSKWGGRLTFKGGTSLSKCYNIIQRFSEDADLILDWRVLGYSKEEPWEQRSNTKQDMFNKEANAKAEKFLAEEFSPVIKQDISSIIGEEALIYIDSIDPQTINFNYPHLFQSESILQTIRLEIGSLAAWTPSIEKSIVPYIFEAYPDLGTQKTTDIMTSSAERTFWEKVTILHHEANRPENLSMPGRYSRHYYDLYCIAHTEYKDNALKDLKLLEKVVEFKVKFYPRKWAKYDDAKPGTIKLIPPEYRLDDLKADYELMGEMIFGERPSFEQLLEYITDLEKEINS